MNIIGLIREGSQQRAVLQSNGYFSRNWDVGRNIGIDRVTGQQTSIVTVINKSNGNLVSAFPGLP